MNDIQMRKERFIRHELLSLVKALDERILKIDYEVHDDGEEFAEVHWLYSDGSGYRVRVRITAYSFKAITTDVLKFI